MTVDRIRFGAEVRDRRERAGWSQAELARRAGTTTNTVARIERGELEPSLSMADRLAEALGVRVDTLIRRNKR